MTSTHVTTPDYLDPPSTSATITTLASASGPGIGTTAISYQVSYGSYNTSEVIAASNQNIGFTVTQGMLLANNLLIGNDDNTPIRDVSYQYHVTSGGDNQFFIDSSVANDGRSVTSTTYGSASLPRESLSDSPEAHLQQSLGGDAGVRPDTSEVRNFPAAITLASIANQGLAAETQALSWDTSHMRLTELKTTRSGSLYIDTSYHYDGWGNLTQSLTNSVVPVSGEAAPRRTSLEDDYSYYDAGSPALALGISGWPADLKDGLGLTQPREDLPAVHVRKIGSWNPNSTSTGPDSTVTEECEYLYNSNGELATKYELTGTLWATTTYAYDGNGQVTGVFGPLSGQETDYLYSYPAGSTYTITTTKASVVLDASSPSAAPPNTPPVSQSLVTVNTYSYLDGSNTKTVDPNLNVTTRVFDPLGRVKVIDEPVLSTKIPETTVSYVDTAGSLSSSVMNPLGLSTAYNFDNLGRLTKVVKTEHNTGESITSSLTYDAWDDVLTLVGPLSSLDLAARTSGLVTSFSYDFRDEPPAFWPQEPTIPRPAPTMTARISSRLLTRWATKARRYSTGAASRLFKPAIRGQRSRRS